MAIAVGLHVSSAGVLTKLEDCSVLNVWCDIEDQHDWSMLNYFLRHNETVYSLFIIFFKSEHCFPAEPFSYLVDCHNERTSFRTMTVFSFGIRTSFRPFFSIIFTGVCDGNAMFRL